MRGELGSISRKGFDVKFGYGLRSRSHRVVQDSSVVIDALKQSCWANMPPELLRDVLMRIEASELTWPPRKNVVACAGVCRSWRENMKEIVKTLEVSGKLTFPISLKQWIVASMRCINFENSVSICHYLFLPILKVLAFFLQPGPRDSLIQCYIKRDRSTQAYLLYLSLNQATSEDGKFLLAARKSGVQRTQITSSLLILKTGPRRMHCVMDAIPASAVKPGGVAPTQTEFMLSSTDSFPSLPFFRSKSTRMENFQSGPLSSQKDGDGMLVLKNKSPRWHEQLQCWCLNFNGRVTVASVKNFQLVASLEDGAAGQQEHENVILQFGKVGKDVFTMDYQYPISAFQAFAICLSSFDTKIACE
ncbi:hypothetical protein C3L33_04064, partial [Rhododendron williamsianum]